MSPTAPSQHCHPGKFDCAVGAHLRSLVHMALDKVLDDPDSVREVVSPAAWMGQVIDASALYRLHAAQCWRKADVREETT